MKIKTMNTDIFDKLSKDKNENKECVSSLTDEEVLFLYEKGSQELETIKSMFESFYDFMQNSFIQSLLQSDNFVEFYNYFNTFTEVIIPDLLKGDTDNFHDNDYVHECISELYNNLYNKYLDK